MTTDEQLDRALRRSLQAPAVPPAFTARWRAGVEQVRDDEAVLLRTRLESERREQLAAFRAEFVRMRRRTFVLCIGVAFVAGAAASAAMPWLLRHFGSLAELAVPLAVAVAGLTAGLLSSRKRFDF